MFSSWICSSRVVLSWFLYYECSCVVACCWFSVLVDWEYWIFNCCFTLRLKLDSWDLVIFDEGFLVGDFRWGVGRSKATSAEDPFGKSRKILEEYKGIYMCIYMRMSLGFPQLRLRNQRKLDRTFMRNRQKGCNAPPFTKGRKWKFFDFPVTLLQHQSYKLVAEYNLSNRLGLNNTSELLN
jgi:hypothetical protein